MKLSKSTEYCLLLLQAMASESHRGIWSAKHLSERTGIGEDTTAKALQALSKAGLIESKLGSCGGYKLDVGSLKNTNFLQLIESSDKPIFIVKCLDGSCHMEPGCTIKNPVITVQNQIKSFLSEIPLTQLIQGGELHS